jgi:acyl-CoA thioesterase-2
MPQSIDELVALLDLETIEDTCSAVGSPGPLCSACSVVRWPASGHGRNPHDRARPRAPLAARLLPAPGRHTLVPIVYDVERTRDGRSFSTRRVVARPARQAHLLHVCVVQVPEEGFEHQDAMPHVAGPEECPELGDVLADLTGRPGRSGTATGLRSTSATPATRDQAAYCTIPGIPRSRGSG